MTAITPTTAAATATATTASRARSGLGALDQGDFLRLMTVQLQQQDPFAPTDQKEMLAQMAQFSALAGTSEMGETLKGIAGKLDALLAAQDALLSAATAYETSTTTPQTATQEI